jgi:hypothetical protein
MQHAESEPEEWILGKGLEDWEKWKGLVETSGAGAITDHWSVGRPPML